VRCQCLICLGLLVSLLGCGPKGPARKSTVKVTGVVLVEGAPPSSSIQIQCHNVAGIEQQMPTLSQAMTNHGGVFELSTYETGDGAPPGDYIITMKWQTFNTMSMTYSGEDRLNGRYSDPATSTFKFTVKDQPLDLGELQLTLK
jgi:hypothetical protein